MRAPSFDVNGRRGALGPTAAKIDGRPSKAIENELAHSAPEVLARPPLIS